METRHSNPYPITITPSVDVDREIYRWIKGLTSTMELDCVILDHVCRGILAPTADPGLIKDVARLCYLS